jgi:hypothetical protein
MKTKSAFSLPLLAATNVSLFAAIILFAAPISSTAQDNSSTTTTTTTQAVPMPPPAPVTTVQSTTVTTVASTSLYIRKADSGDLHDGENIYDSPNGKVYNSDGDYIGHLTNVSGSDIAALPVRDEFKIRSPGGTMIASTRPSSAYDSDRKVMLSLKDESVPAATTSTTTTTRQTTVNQ